ncbi:MAG: hypothetical protein WB554_00935, partial [Desulfomonilaceae bacterium]
IFADVNLRVERRQIVQTPNVVYKVDQRINLPGNVPKLPGSFQNRTVQDIPAAIHYVVDSTAGGA